MRRRRSAIDGEGTRLCMLHEDGGIWERRRVGRSEGGGAQETGRSENSVGGGAASVGEERGEWACAARPGGQVVKWAARPCRRELLGWLGWKSAVPGGRRKGVAAQ